ncbi:cell division protein FtsZ [bacterium]|nr:cell division protein FtsZ [bacterium]
MFEINEASDFVLTQIKIVGVGGAGGNAINTMINNKLDNVEFIAMNSDVQDLKKSLAPNLVQLGPKATSGRGAGALPEIGEKAAEESYEEIKKALNGADLVFLVAGMGGGTGTGALPIVARAAKEMNILTMAVVTKPFPYEGKIRLENAELGLKNLRGFVDTLLVIPNNKILENFPTIGVVEGFRESDMIIYNGVKSISDIITRTGYINVEFSDIKTIMRNMGYALIGSGEAEGEDRAIIAAQAAITNPLLGDISIAGCKALLINIFAGSDMKMNELENACNTITSQTGTNIICINGLFCDPEYDGRIRVTVLATGLEMDQEKMETITSLNKISKPKEYPDLDNYGMTGSMKGFGSLHDNLEGDDMPMEEEKTEEKHIETELPPFLNLLD